MNHLDRLIESAFSRDNLIFFPYNDDWVAYAPGKKKMILLPNTNEDSVRQARELLQPEAPVALKPFQRLILFPTTRCNFRCTYCYAKAGERSLDMDWETAKTAIDFFLSRATTKYPVFSFHGGGEPTLNSQLVRQSVEYIRSSVPFVRGMFSIGTNGMIDDDLLEFLIQNGFRFSVSYDGLPEIQDTQRPLGKSGQSHMHVERTLRKIAQVDAPYCISCTVASQNIHLIPAIVSHISDLGLTNLGIHVVFPRGKGKNVPASREDYLEYQRQRCAAIDLAKTRGIKLNFTDILSSCNPRCALSSLTSMAVTTDGFISGCLEITHAKVEHANDFLLGTVDRVMGTVEIDNTKVDIFRTRFTKMQQCANCVVRNICCGGCSISAKAATGSIYTEDEVMCEMIRMETLDLLHRAAQATFV